MYRFLFKINLQLEQMTFNVSILKTHEQQLLLLGQAHILTYINVEIYDSICIYIFEINIVLSPYIYINWTIK